MSVSVCSPHPGWVTAPTGVLQRDSSQRPGKGMERSPGESQSHASGGPWGWPFLQPSGAAAPAPWKDSHPSWALLGSVPARRRAAGIGTPAHMPSASHGRGKQSQDRGVVTQGSLSGRRGRRWPAGALQGQQRCQEHAGEKLGSRPAGPPPSAPTQQLLQGLGQPLGLRAWAPGAPLALAGPAPPPAHKSGCLGADLQGPTGPLCAALQTASPIQEPSLGLPEATCWPPLSPAAPQPGDWCKASSRK